MNIVHYLETNLLRKQRLVKTPVGHKIWHWLNQPVK